MKFLIYKHKNTINKKVYIGQTNRTMEKRWCGHCKATLSNVSTCIFQNALRKYGFECWEHEILEDNIYSKQEANIAEIFWIDFYQSNNKEFGYNMTPGGEYSPMLNPELAKKNGDARHGRKHSPEARKRISDATTGRHLSEEHKDKISKIHKGKTTSEETKKKMSEAQKGEKSKWFGRHHTEESKRKIGEASRLNNPMKRPEIAKQVADKKRGDNHPIRKHPELFVNFTHQCGENNPRARAVKQIDRQTGEVIATYKTLKEAYQQTGITHIIDFCKGSRRSKKFIWEYVDNNK